MMPRKVSVSRLDGPVELPGLPRADPMTIYPSPRPKPLQKSISLAEALMLSSAAAQRKRNPMRTDLLPVNLKSARG